MKGTGTRQPRYRTQTPNRPQLDRRRSSHAVPKKYHAATRQLTFASDSQGVYCYPQRLANSDAWRDLIPISMASMLTPSDLFFSFFDHRSCFLSIRSVFFLGLSEATRLELFVLRSGVQATTRPFFFSLPTLSSFSPPLVLCETLLHLSVFFTASPPVNFGRRWAAAGANKFDKRSRRQLQDYDKSSGIDRIQNRSFRTPARMMDRIHSFGRARTCPFL